MRRHGRLVKVGVEGTGSYGAGLARYMAGEGVAVVELNRPNRQTRRRRGKSDPTDAGPGTRTSPRTRPSLAGCLSSLGHLPSSGYLLLRSVPELMGTHWNYTLTATPKD